MTTSRSSGATGTFPASPRGVEVDSETGVEIVQLTPDGVPCINIYGEQPYNSADGTRIAVEVGQHEGSAGRLAILDLAEGVLHTVIDEQPQFPAFHGWGTHLYCKQMVGGSTVLRRFDYHTLKSEDILTLPGDMKAWSYGTVSQDHRYYAVSAGKEGVAGNTTVQCFDLSTGERTVLVDDARYNFKHEQFSRDGQRRVMIQGNVKPPEMPADVMPKGWKHWPQVHLGVLEVSREGMRRFAVDEPYTPRATGHEAWIGTESRVFFSTGQGPGDPGNLWTAAVPTDDTPPPAPVCVGGPHGGHVTVSRCGRFVMVDALDEPSQPLYVGCLATGRWRRVLNSCSKPGDTPWGNQWSHTHPYFTADLRWIIFSSIRNGMPHVYGGRLPAGLLEDLANA